MTDLPAALSRALPTLGGMSLTAAYAAAVVAVLRLILKKRAPKRVLSLLWLVVFARLLIPVSLESPVSIVPDARQVRQLTQRAPIPPEANGGQAVPLQPAGQDPAQGHDPAQNPAQGHEPAQGPAQGHTGGAADPVSQGNANNANVPVLTAPGGTAPAAPPPEAPSPFPWQAVLAGVWLAGTLAMGGSALASYLRLRRRLYDAIRAPDGAWEHPSVSSPFILGVFRPKIYLPAGLRGQPRQFILCHERAHLRRLDHIIKPVCWAALAVHWFNPAVWLAFVLMGRDIEAACDEAVLRQLGPEVKADYSATLLSLATGGRIPAPCPLAFDEGDAKGRIQNVLKYQRPTLWIVAVSAIMAVMAAVCLLTDPVSAEAPDAAPSPGAEASQTPEPSAAQPTQPPALEDWMLEVLSGRREFRRPGAERGYTVRQLRSFFYGDVEPPQITVEAGRVTALDLDRDGENELIVFPEGDDEYLYSYVGYLILRQQGDEIAAYAPGWRSVGNLKADGTFHWSSSSFNAGTGRARFTEDGGLEIEDVTWFDNPNEGDENYFVDGTRATKEEFLAAQSAQNAKPEPIWYALEDGALRRLAPDIPMDAAAWSIPLPEFMTGAQQNLYQRAYSLYTHILGGNPAQIDAWPAADPLPPAGEVEVDGQRYVPANGLYARWDDFESAVLSVFTPSFWEQRNRWEGKRYGEAYPLFVNVDGRTYYHPMSRASGGYNGNFPETFWATEETDAALAFTMTGHYSNPCLLEGEDEAARAARYAAGYEYVIEFPLRMVNTEEGWRFEEFRCAQTDDLESPFIDSHNPILRTTPDTTRVTACAHGLDYVFLDEWNGRQVLRCRVDRFPYVLPAPFTAYNTGGGAYDDMDGDGHDEYSFLTDDFSTLMVCDVEDGRLKTCTTQPGPLLDDFIQNLDYRYTDSGGVLTLETSYQGQTIQTRFTGSNRELVLGYGEKNAPVPGYWSRWVEPYTGQDVIISQDLYIEGSVERAEQSAQEPVVLVGAVQWTFRYEGGELKYVPGSFRLLPLSADWEDHVY